MMEVDKETRALEAKLRNARSDVAELVGALEANDEILVATFALVGAPERRHGWSDDDAWQQHQRNLATIAKHTAPETGKEGGGDATP